MPHLVELNRAEDVNAFREELLDVAEQVGVHGGAEDGDNSTIRDAETVRSQGEDTCRKTGNAGIVREQGKETERQRTQRLSGDTKTDGLRGQFGCTKTVSRTWEWTADVGTVREHGDSHRT